MHLVYKCFYDHLEYKSQRLSAHLPLELTRWAHPLDASPTSITPIRSTWRVLVQGGIQLLYSSFAYLFILATDGKSIVYSCHSLPYKMCGLDSIHVYKYRNQNIPVIVLDENSIT